MIWVIDHHLLLTSAAVAAAAADVVKPDEGESEDHPNNMQHYNRNEKKYPLIATKISEISYHIAHYAHNYRGYHAVYQCPWSAESNSQVRLSLTGALVFGESEGCNFYKSV